MIFFTSSSKKTSLKAIKNAIEIFTYDKDFKENNNSKEAIFYNSIANNKYLNCWNEKALQLTIDDDKNMVLLIDRFFIDAATYGEMFNEINEEFVREVDFFKIKDYAIAKYQTLNFGITAKKLQIIEQKFQDFIVYKNSVYAKAIKFDWLKRSQLKALGVKGIDAFLQLGYQRAQYLTNQEIQNTYVAVDMRRFFGGRTECIRPVSDESKEFVSKMVQYLRVAKSAKSELDQIYDIHYTRIQMCQRGYGINRHILGLKLFFLETESEFGFENLEIAYKQLSELTKLK